MKWLEKIPNSARCPSGLEWHIWRKLPVIALTGTLMPLLLVVIMHMALSDSATAQELRWLQMADYFWLAVVIFHWTMVLTVGIGCVIVMIMKGPAYKADSLNVSHSDAPRPSPETEAESADYRVR